MKLFTCTGEIRDVDGTVTPSLVDDRDGEAQLAQDQKRCKA